MRTIYRLGTACLAAAALLGAGGCANFWDEVTSRDFKFKNLFEKAKDPIVVLRTSADGDQRAKAIVKLREPKQHGGSDQDQQLVMELLIKAATQDRQPLCRLAAVQKLGEFKDPRTVQTLEDAFLSAGEFPSDTATHIQCAAMTSLGNTGNPAVIPFLAEKLREPAAERSDLAQQRTDRCSAAARALARFHEPEAAEALAQVLKREKDDVALRERAHEALQDSTGKRLPPDYQAWDDYLHKKSDPNANAGKSILPVRWLSASP